jgi:hypothetical protein
LDEAREGHSPEVIPSSFPLPPGHTSFERPPSPHSPTSFPPRRDSMANRQKQERLAVPREASNSKQNSPAREEFDREGLYDNDEHYLEAPPSPLPPGSLADELRRAKLAARRRESNLRGKYEQENENAPEISNPEAHDNEEDGFWNQDLQRLSAMPEGSSAEVLPLSLKPRPESSAMAEINRGDVTTPDLNPYTGRGESTDWTPPSKTRDRETSL